MSGHSKWSQIKRQKGTADAKRGQLFTKLTREIIVAVRQGGSNHETNFRLRLATQKARDNNMPLDNIERAIKRGSGELEGVTLVEMILEGYGPGGVAMLIQVLTDNKNRSVAEIRHILSKQNGNMGEAGCVNWMFAKQGFIQVEAEGVDEDTLMMVALDASATDVKNEGASFDIYTEPGDLEAVRGAVEESGVTIASAELAMIPQNTIKLDEKQAGQMLRLMEALEDHDDVQKVYANFDIDDELIDKLAG